MTIYGKIWGGMATPWQRLRLQQTYGGVFPTIALQVINSNKEVLEN